MIYTDADISSMEKRYRTNFINTISGPRTVFLVSTLHESGKSNVAIFNSIIHLGADPPLLGLISRPDSVERHTLENIRRAGEFTLSSVSASWLKQAHQTSARYPREVSEYSAAGLKESWKKGIPVPFVEGAPLHIFLKSKSIIDIPLNGTYMIVGQIQLVDISDTYADLEGRLKGFGDSAVLSHGLDTYGIFHEKVQLPYAKIK